MSGTCETCDGDVTNKNSAGHYRDKCADCLKAVADAIDTTRPACEMDDCETRAVGPNSSGRWLCSEHMAVVRHD